MMDQKLKYLDAAAAFATLSLVGCGDKDVFSTNKDVQKELTKVF